jgi:hypothetical protein
VFAQHGRCSSDAVAIGAISRSLAGGYARDQGRPHSKQSLCLQSGSGTRIVAQPRRISLVLHIGREALDKLARATRGAHRSRPGQTFPRHRTAERILRRIRRLLCRVRFAPARHGDSKQPVGRIGAGLSAVAQGAKAEGVIRRVVAKRRRVTASPTTRPTSCALRHSGRWAIGSPGIRTKCLRSLVDCLSRFGMK